jgi:hypothetical protein
VKIRAVEAERHELVARSEKPYNDAKFTNKNGQKPGVGEALKRIRQACCSG